MIVFNQLKVLFVNEKIEYVKAKTNTRVYRPMCPY